MATYISSTLTKDKSKVIVWERNGDNRYHVEHDAPFNMFIEDPDGKYRSVTEKKLSQVKFDKAHDFYSARKRYQEEGIKTYESDISPELKILSDKYYGNEVADQLHITFYDIEVDYDPEKGHASGSNPYARISSIALYHLHSDRSIVLATPPKSGKWKGSTIDDIPDELKEQAEITIYKNEKELLIKFFEEIEDSDVVSGWNSEFFDDPYIYFRTGKVLGANCQNLMNFEGADKDVKVDETEKFGNLELTVKPVGRIWIDYMQMVKKFDPNERSSYSLEAVAEEELDDMEKLDYGKSLFRLYHEDFDKYIKYNIRDTAILKGLETKFKYMDLAIQFSHMVTNHMHSVLGTVSTSDTAILNFCKFEMDGRKVLPDANRDIYEDGKKFEGALVLNPIAGLHEYVGSVDIKSLYPSAIRAVNISPDTIIGQFFDSGTAWENIQNETSEEVTILYENEMDETMTGKDWKSYLNEKNWSVSANGTVFDQSHDGIIPAILTSWFESRIEMQDKKKELESTLDTLDKRTKEYKEIKKKVDYYDNIQYLKKIQLNSMYGVFGNKYFRFFDHRLAESTTKTGQAILMHMCKKVAEVMDEEYTYPSKSIVYGDTDSVYFETQTDNKDDAIFVADTVATVINKSYPKYMKDAFVCTHGRENYIIAEREVISDRGIFIKKKHYMLHLVNKDGYDVDKMKVMGLQIKKTSIPKFIREKITKCFEKFLKGEDWLLIKKEIVNFKDELLDGDLLRLGVPSSVNKVEYYTNEYNLDNKARVPGHVKASILYNKCLDVYKDGESMKIYSSMKIKKYYFYSKKKFGSFTSIALPTDLDIMPEWLDNFLPYIDRERQLVTLIDKPIKNILDAIGEAVPNAKNVMADELVEFD